jgi:hypothetical protein
VDVLSNTLQRLFRLLFHGGKLVSGAFECENQFLKLDLQGQGVAVLRCLNEKHHQKVMMVVPVLITSGQVSLKWKRGPVIAHMATIATAPRKVIGFPERMAVSTASLLNQSD